MRLNRLLWTPRTKDIRDIKNFRDNKDIFDIKDIRGLVNQGFWGQRGYKVNQVCQWNSGNQGYWGWRIQEYSNKSIKDILRGLADSGSRIDLILAFLGPRFGQILAFSGSGISHSPPTWVASQIGRSFQPGRIILTTAHYLDRQLSDSDWIVIW